MRADPAVSRGRLAIDRAADGMPVLGRLREEYAATRPLRGERIAGCVHLTKETAVLIRCLQAAGAVVAWTGGDEISTQEDVAAALAAEGVQVFSRSPMSSAE